MNEVREPLGRSLHDVLGRCGQLTAVPQAPVSSAAAGISDPELTGALAAAGQLARSWGPVERGPDFLWRGCNETRFDARTRQQISDELRALREALSHVSNEARDVADILRLAATTSFVEARKLVVLLELLDSRPPDVPAEWLTRESLGTVRERLSEVLEIAGVHADACAALERLALTPRALSPASSRVRAMTAADSSTRPRPGPSRRPTLQPSSSGASKRSSRPRASASRRSLPLLGRLAPPWPSGGTEGRSGMHRPWLHWVYSVERSTVRIASGSTGHPVRDRSQAP